MANELTIIENNWLTLADHAKELPIPFEQTIFLTKCHIAGTEEIDDILVKTRDVEPGTELVLRRTAKDAVDSQAVSVLADGEVLVGYLPRCYSAVMARLMDAGKQLAARVAWKEQKGHWLDITITIELKEV